MPETAAASTILAEISTYRSVDSVRPLIPVLFASTALLLNAQETELDGVSLYNAGEFAKARQIFEQEIASSRATSQTHFWLGYTYLALSARDLAVPQFERYLAADPGNEDVLYALARTYAQLAEMSLQQIFQLDPRSARAYQMRGIRFELEESWKEALAEYDKAAALSAGMPGVHRARARIYAQELADETAAAAAYERELTVNPFDRQANEFLGAYYRRVHQPELAARCRKMLDTELPEAEGDAAIGIRLVESGKARESLPYLFRWRAAEPENTDAYYYLGEALADMKVETIQRLKSANPESYRLHQILAEHYASIHKRAEAAEEYRKVLQMQPGVPGIRYELARLISDTEIEQAVPLLEQELEIDPNHYLAKSLLGRIHVALHQPGKAIPLLQEAVAARGSLMEARKALGQALTAMKEFDKALDQYRRVLDANPAEEQIHYLMAQAFQGLGKHEEAARERALHQEALKRLRER